jgi:hypothetical protein
MRWGSSAIENGAISLALQQESECLAIPSDPEIWVATLLSGTEVKFPQLKYSPQIKGQLKRLNISEEGTWALAIETRFNKIIYQIHFNQEALIQSQALRISEKNLTSSLIRQAYVVQEWCLLGCYTVWLL